MSITRNRTPSEYIWHALYLYFLGLSLRNVAKALSYLHIVKRSHVAVWNWIQKYKPQKISIERKRISEFIIDETLIKVGSEYIWLWVTIEPENRQILAVTISKERSMLIAERFIWPCQRLRKSSSINRNGGSSWYPQACQVLKLDHHIHSSLEKA